ncbi:SAG1252 family conjugative relaxosome accessory protein, partial [Streptococcus suis]
MSQDLKLIRKQFRVTKQEEILLKEMMKEQGSETFSDFLRQNLLQKDRQKDILETWSSLWQSQKLEEISRDIHQVTVLAEEYQQVTSEHLRIILTCVLELMAEVEK